MAAKLIRRAYGAPAAFAHHEIFRSARRMLVYERKKLDFFLYVYDAIYYSRSR